MRIFKQLLTNCQRHNVNWLEIKAPRIKYWGMKMTFMIFFLLDPYQLLTVNMRERSPHTSYRRGGKVTILKCFWTFWSFYKKSPSNILFYNILPTLTREIIPSLAFWSHLQGKKLLGSTYEVSELVLTNNLRSNHRIIVCSLSLPPYLSTTQNRLLYNNGLQLNGLRLQGSDPM